MRVRYKSLLMAWVLAVSPASLCMAQAHEGGEVLASGYPGVVPGTDHGPAVPAAPNTVLATITWPGFQALPGGGSRVFVQSTAPLGTEVVRKGRTLRIMLGSAQLSHRNNARPLDTRFFDTPVARAYVKMKKGQATLFVELRQDAEPVVSTAPGVDGYYFLYVDFPGSRPHVAATSAPVILQSAPAAQPSALPARGSAESANMQAQGSASGDAHATTSEGKASAGGEVKAGGSLKLGF